MAMRVYCSGGCGSSEWRTDQDGYAGYLCARCAQGQRVTSAPTDGNSNDGGGWPCLMVMLLLTAVTAGLTTAVLGVIL